MCTCFIDGRSWHARDTRVKLAAAWKAPGSARSSSLCLLGGIGHRDIDRSRLTVTHDRQFHSFSDTDLLENVGEIGPAVDRLPIHGGNDVGHGTTIDIGAFQPRLCGGRFRQRPRDDDAVDVQARRLAFARRDNSDSWDRNRPPGVLPTTR
jgi:hypothetical protein